MPKPTRKHLSFFKSYRLLPLLILAVLVIAALEVTNVTHFFHKRPQTTQVVIAGTPVKAPANAAKNTTPDKPISNTNGSRNSGGATDTHGTSSSQTDSSQWVTSASGYITVKQPAANAKLQSGDVLSGTAKVNEVHYRLKDNQVGQIAEGTLSVVEGKFSGVLHFSPQGTGGRLDVFSTNDQGVEYNEVQINVVF